MPLLNKNRIAYLGALTLLFSYAEMILPKIFPFFRLGFGNIAILLALDLSIPNFLILTVLKSLASSMMAGTLFSPFFIISISQSIISGFVMYVFNRTKGKWLSIYGISMIGSAVSTLVQIFLASIYLGSSTLKLLGPMLIFSIVAAIITAFCSKALKIPEKTPELKNTAYKTEPVKSIVLCVLILTITITCFMIKNLWILLAVLCLSFIFQKVSKRRILFLPHLSIWIFVILISLFTPNGKVLFSIGKFSITKGALILGIQKALKLSIAAALSQCAASLKPSPNSILGLSLLYYKQLSDNFRNSTEKNIFKRIQKACN